MGHGKQNGINNPSVGRVIVESGKTHDPGIGLSIVVMAIKH